MIAVHVGNEDAAKLAYFEVTALELVLGSFSAVKEPEFRFLGKTKGDRRNIPRSGRDTGASSKKSNLHARVSRGDCVLYFNGSGLREEGFKTAQEKIIRENQIIWVLYANHLR